MQQSLKNQLATALRQYMDIHGMSQNEVAKQCGVNAAYLIPILKGKDKVTVAGKETLIADKYYKRIATLIDFPLEKSYWDTVHTLQLKSMITTLSEAKSNGETAVITGSTGSGKTYINNLFKKKHPHDYFVVTVGSSDNLGDLLDKILEAMKTTSNGRSKSARIRHIVNTLRAMSEDGREPALCFDEAEYMKQPALCSLKELYDNLNDHCAIILIGTEQLTFNLEKLKKRNKPGIPQLYRRLRYRVRQLPPIDKSYSSFLNGVKTDVRKWLIDKCDNIGELHDVLVPARREAERSGTEVSIELIETILGL